MSDDMQIAVIDNYLMIKMPQEVDHHRAADIRLHADAMLFQQNVKNIVFDFEDTTFMDSSGIGIVLGRYRRMQERDGRLYLSGLGGSAEKILRMAGVLGLVERK